MKLNKTILSVLAVALLAAGCSKTENEDPQTPPPAGLIGDLPADPQPESFNFHRRALIVDHTGTGCGYCPFVMGSVYTMLESEEYADRVEAAVIHNYNNSDPMKTALNISVANQLKGGGVPNINVDLRYSKDASRYGTSMDVKMDYTKLKTLVNNQLEAHPAKVGIAAKVEPNGTAFNVTTAVKIGEAGEYKLNIWVLEDGIRYLQANDGAKGFDFFTHNHVLRAALENKIAGVDLGEGKLEQGEIVEKTYSIPISKDITNPENCHVLVYVTTPDEAGSNKFWLNNVIRCDLGEEVAFEYAEE